MGSLPPGRVSLTTCMSCTAPVCISVYGRLDKIRYDQVSLQDWDSSTCSLASSSFRLDLLKNNFFASDGGVAAKKKNKSSFVSPFISNPCRRVGYFFFATTRLVDIEALPMSRQHSFVKLCSKTSCSIMYSSSSCLPTTKLNSWSSSASPMNSAHHHWEGRFDELDILSVSTNPRRHRRSPARQPMQRLAWLIPNM